MSVSELSDWFPVDQFAERHRERFTIYQVRWLLRFAQTNGLIEAGAAVKVGKRWFLSESGFASWLAGHRNRAAA